MSSYKLNDPTAPTYRRNYRTHLALEMPVDVNGDISNTPNSVRSPTTTVQDYSTSDQDPLLSGTTSDIHDIPVDTLHFVKFSLFLLGLVSLIPWNFFITATEYWMFKFRDVSNSTLPAGGKTELQTEFFSMLAIVTNVPYLAVLYLSTFVNDKVPQKFRNSLSLFTMTLLFATVTIMVPMDSDTWQRTFYQITLVVTLFLSIFGAWYQGGMMGLASIFPADYTQINIVGQAVGGLFASVLQIIVLSANVSHTSSGLMFFSCALLLLLVSLVIFFYMHTLPFFKFHMRNSSHGTQDIGFEDLEVKVRTWLIVRKVWKHCATLVAIYLVTMSVFPGVLVHVESMSKGDGSEWSERFFSPVVCFLLFNLGDTVGRLLSSSVEFPRNRENLMLTMALLRILLVPLFFSCNVQPRMPWMPVVLQSDWWFVLLVALFSLSNGYLTSVAMVQGPKKVEYYLQEKVGTVLVSMLATGMGVGSLLSLAFIKMFFDAHST